MLKGKTTWAEKKKFKNLKKKKNSSSHKAADPILEGLEAKLYTTKDDEDLWRTSWYSKYICMHNNMHVYCMEQSTWKFRSIKSSEINDANSQQSELENTPC